MVAVHGDQLFEEVGKTLVVGSDKPFLLRRGFAWYLRSGSINVFSVPVENGQAAGGRRHLFRVRPGQLIIGVNSDDAARGLVAVGSAGTEVIEVPVETLAELADRTETSVTISVLLDLWVDLVYSSLGGTERPETCQDLDPGSYSIDEEASPVRPGRSVLWMRCENEGALLFGEEAMAISGSSMLPVSRKGWVQVPQESQISFAQGDAVVNSPQVWSALDQLHDLLLRRVSERAAIALAAERERLLRRQVVDQRVMGAACRQLAGTLEGKQSKTGLKVAATADTTRQDALQAACKVLGESLGIEVMTATQPGQSSVQGDPLQTIARNSRFRTRQVLLRDSWWRQPGSPLLAYLSDSKRPVALVPTNRSQYVLHDPVDMKETVVTEAVADSLEPTAHCFYRPFGDQAIGFFGLLKFGLRGCRRDVTNIFLMGAAAGLLGLLTPVVTGVLFNDIIPGAERSQLLQLTMVLVVIAFATTMFNITGAIALVRVDTKLSTSVLCAVWDRLLRLPMSFFRPYTSGDLANRAMSVESIRQTLSGHIATSVIQGLFSLFQLGLMFSYSSFLAWWALGLIGFAVLIAVTIGRLQMTPERAVASVRSKLAGTVLQFLSSVSKLRVAAAEVQAFAVWADRFSEQRRHQLRSRSIGYWLTILSSGLPLVCQLVIYALAVPLLTEEHSLRVGDFLAFMSSFTICLGGLLGAIMAIISSAVVIPLYEHARPILRALPEVDDAKADPGQLNGDIEVQHLHFRYSEDGPAVLNDVSLRIKAGEFVALVGPSGSGKSTILRLLLGFDDPESGNIYYDGQEFSGLDRQSVRAQIGVVLQGGRLMAGDIFTNIVGSSLATIDDAWEAARMAGLDKDIRVMPMGMHTVISEGGGTFSGGQRQRLMIARALVRRPKMLFFDEATSALDNRTQAIVSESLDRMRASRLVVAHRLSTIQHADRIYVLESGRLVDSGTYEQLYRRKGLFYELAKRQIA